jgi:acyl phosphate:glycerol-3-phosphate acyltransferase
MNIALIVLALLAAYLIGSFPSAYLMGRLRKGIDIRQVGSHNMGAMNTFYEVGFVPGLIVLALDIGKGATAAALARLLGVDYIIQLFAGVAAVLGHSFPPWLRFRGGKGGASIIGILAYLMPWGAPIYLAVFGLLLLITRFPTLSYGVAFVTFPIVAWLIYHQPELVVYSVFMLLALLIGYIPRIKEIRAKAGNWKHAAVRKSTKERI